jgi:hypothetical protein
MVMKMFGRWDEIDGWMWDVRAIERKADDGI